MYCAYIWIEAKWQKKKKKKKLDNVQQDGDFDKKNQCAPTSAIRDMGSMKAQDKQVQHFY